MIKSFKFKTFRNHLKAQTFLERNLLENILMNKFSNP